MKMFVWKIKYTFIYWFHMWFGKEKEYWEFVDKEISKIRRASHH